MISTHKSAPIFNNGPLLCGEFYSAGTVEFFDKIKQ